MCSTLGTVGTAQVDLQSLGIDGIESKGLVTQLTPQTESKQVLVRPGCDLVSTINMEPANRVLGHAYLHPHDPHLYLKLRL